MLELSELSWSQGAAELGILCLLEVSQEVLLCLTALEVAILLWVHSEFEELLIVLTILPTVLVHLLLEVIECVAEQCVSIYICKLTTLLLGKLYEFWINLSRNLTTLTEDHTPHRIIHHYEAALALLHGKEVHQ